MTGRQIRSLAVALGSALCFGAVGSGCVAAADQVAIAYIGGTADVGFYLADARGYLRDEAIEAKFTIFDSSARMVAPLATGDIDVGSGAVNAGTYNAFDRGLTMKVVADKARNKGAFSYQGLVVRKDLWDKGAVRAVKDLKGRKFALTAQGNNEGAVLNEALRAAGLAFSDVDPIYLSLPQQVAAFANGAIDASFVPEPFLTQALRTGAVVQMTPVSALRDDDVTGNIIYSDKLIKERSDVARRVMKAYIRGLRDYVDVLKDARLAGPGAEAVIDVIARYSSVTDKALLRAITPHYVDPNGGIELGSLRKDLLFYHEIGLYAGEASVDQIVDTHFVSGAIKELGPYAPKP